MHMQDYMHIMHMQARALATIAQHVLYCTYPGAFWSVDIDIIISTKVELYMPLIKNIPYKEEVVA